MSRLMTGALVFLSTAMMLASGAARAASDPPIGNGAADLRTQIVETHRQGLCAKAIVACARNRANRDTAGREARDVDYASRAGHQTSVAARARVFESRNPTRVGGDGRVAGRARALEARDST